ncbi:MAG: carboxypeptidase-like regulatory domain-containing protein, partial [Bacteroidales bacterium]|nr:carboxypeptidase-like regulatory domain-containing protein [Bacteroidales bacterium]
MKQKFRTIRKLLMFSLLALPLYVSAQVITVTGTVTDEESGLPLPGVTVVAKATTLGTITDFDGNYTLTVQPGAVLSFSFVGYATKEVPVNDQTVLNVTLSEEKQALDEVVV